MMKSYRVQIGMILISQLNVGVTGKERFKGKKVIEVPTKVVVHNAEALIKKVESMLA